MKRRNSIRNTDRIFSRPAAMTAAQSPAQPAFMHRRNSHLDPRSSSKPAYICLHETPPPARLQFYARHFWSSTLTPPPIPNFFLPFLFPFPETFPPFPRLRCGGTIRQPLSGSNRTSNSKREFSPTGGPRFIVPIDHVVCC